MLKTIFVKEAFTGLLYEDGVFVKALKPGKYEFRDGFWKTISREVTPVDMRQRSLTIKGQEILTADKVAIRVSILVYFRVVDPVSALHEVASYQERIYEDVQLAARRYLASKNLDAILSDRNEISDTVRDDVKESAASYGLEIIRADVKDLVFPGNLRNIMNQVLETERRSEAKLIVARKDAEANLITATAQNEAHIKRLEAEKQQIRLKAEAERTSLQLKLEGELETAKALVENPILLKLKQLEVLKEMAKSGNGKFVFTLSPGEMNQLLED